MFDLIAASELETPAHNLVSSVDTQDNRDGKWENGVTFTNHGCFIVNGSCLFCDDSPSNTFDDQDCTPAAEFKPFELDLGTTWTPADNFDLIKLVESDFDTGTSSKLERMAWEGCAGGTNPTLGGGTSLGGALTPKQSLGNMAAALIDSDDHIGAKGTIYMPPRVAFEMADLLITKNDGQLRTVYGDHLVIVGNFPSNSIAGHIGEPIVFLGDIRVTEAPDEVRRANLRTVRVQRSALVAWNDCAAFVQSVTLP